MFDIANIKDNEDYLIFFKIIEKQYLDSLVKDGQVYFNLLSVYRKMEEEDGKVSIGDATEGLLTKKIQKYIGFQGEYYQIHGSDSGYNAKVDSNQCVFCSYAVGLKSFESKDNQIYYHKMPYSTIENICKDKGGIDNCVILVFDIDIIDRICNALKGRLSFCRGLVVYDNFDYIPQNDINSVKYALECCFHKDSKYEYQKEFRIAAINDTNYPIDNLYISVTEKDFDIIELKENCDFCCYVKVDAERIEDYNGKEQQAVLFSFSFDLENNQKQDNNKRSKL